MTPAILSLLLLAAPPMREPFDIRASSPATTRVLNTWYVAPERTCTRGYKKPTVCVEQGEPLRGMSTRYIPSDRPVTFYALGFGPGTFVRVFVRSWYAGAEMPGVAGAPLSVVVYPQRGESVQLQVAKQPTCAGCE